MSHREELLDAMPLFAVERGQCAAVHMEAGHLLREFLSDDEDRHIRPPFQRIAQTLKPALSQQKRPRPIAGVDGTPNDLLTLGNEEAVFGFEVSSQ